MHNVVTGPIMHRYTHSIGTINAGGQLVAILVRGNGILTAQVVVHTIGLLGQVESGISQ